MGSHIKAHKNANLDNIKFIFCRLCSRVIAYNYFILIIIIFKYLYKK